MWRDIPYNSRCAQSIAGSLSYCPPTMLTLLRTAAELDSRLIDEVVLVDDASTDHTSAVARKLGLEPEGQR